MHVYGLVSNDEGMWAETTYVGCLVCSEVAEGSEEGGVMSDECGVGSDEGGVMSDECVAGGVQEAVGHATALPPTPQ